MGGRRKRRASRVDIAAPLLVRVSVGDEPAFDGYCDNLSLGGMFIRASQTAPAGTRIDLALKLPTGDEITFAATVRWTTERGMGIQHNLLGARQTFTLTKYIASLPKLPGS